MDGEDALTAHFYFDLVSGPTVLRDDEGTEADGFENALAAATTVIDELRDGGDLAEVRDEWELVIRNTAVRAIGRLPIR